MPFAVMNSVTIEKEKMPAALADAQLLDLDAYRAHDGFRRVSVFVSEDGTQLVTLAEWDSRDHFMAFRQTDVGRRTVELALPWHPHIAFFETVASVTQT